MIKIQKQLLKKVMGKNILKLYFPNSFGAKLLDENYAFFQMHFYVIWKTRMPFPHYFWTPHCPCFLLANMVPEMWGYVTLVFQSSTLYREKSRRGEEREGEGKRKERKKGRRGKEGRKIDTQINMLQKQQLDSVFYLPDP